MGTGLTIEIQTLKDYEAGKLLFKDYATEIQKEGMAHGELKAIGVLEGGAENNKTSITLLIRVEVTHETEKAQIFYVTADLTAALLFNSAAIIHRHAQHFEGKPKGDPNASLM